jgi:hypothetical protein
LCVIFKAQVQSKCESISGANCLSISDEGLLD